MGNRNWERDLEAVGRSAAEAIEKAIQSQDYEKLNQTLQKTIDTAVDAGSEVVHRAAREVKRRSGWDQGWEDLGRSIAKRINGRRKYTVEPTPVRQTEVVVTRNLYGSTAGWQVGGILKVVFGSLLACGFFGALLATVPLGLLGIGSGMFSATGAVLAAGTIGGIGLLCSGIGNLGAIGRFNRYTKFLGTATHCKLEALSAAVRKPLPFVRRDVAAMIDRGWFLEGHLDKEGKTLLTSRETYEAYEKSRLLLLERQQQAQRERETEDKSRAAESPKLRAVLERGNTFLTQIHDCNARIPDKVMSEKISGIASLVQSIFTRARQSPEIIPKLQKLMDYYLPMTVKLLNAYADMDAQAVQGENIRKSKREIAATLDTLNTAFETLLDELYAPTAVDVSSDISVLQTLLAQEGLTRDDLSKRKP